MSKKATRTLSQAVSAGLRGRVLAGLPIAPLVLAGSPVMAQQVIDWSIQAHGGGGVSDDFAVAQLWAHNRTLRIADGPDEVHRNAIAKLELAKYASLSESLDLPITRS